MQLEFVMAADLCTTFTHSCAEVCGRLTAGLRQVYGRFMAGLWQEIITVRNETFEHHQHAINGSNICTFNGGLWQKALLRGIGFLKGFRNNKSAILGMSVRLAQRTIDAAVATYLVVTVVIRSECCCLPTGYSNCTFDSASKIVALCSFSASGLQIAASSNRHMLSTERG